MSKTPKKRASRARKSAGTLNFEQSLEALEHIVEALEEGGLSLDESLQKFEEGVGLAKACEKTLAEAEKKIEILTENAEGELEAAPFGDDDADDDSDDDDSDDDEDAEDGDMLF